MSLVDTKPLREDLTFGAQITGVTRQFLKPEDVRRELNTIFEERGIIVFDDVEPSSQMPVALSNVFGPLKEHPVKVVTRLDQGAMPGVIVISSTPVGGIVEIDGHKLRSWQHMSIYHPG